MRCSVGLLGPGHRVGDPPDVLLLDEPTNHFSLLLAAEIESSIWDHPGAVAVASHDRWVRESWQGERLDLGRPVAAPAGMRSASRGSGHDR